MSRELVVDSSVLFAIFEKDVPIDLSTIIDLVHPSRTVILTSCLREIERKMLSGSPREKSIARSIINMIEKLGLEIEEAKSEICDEAITSYCSGRENVVVATLDNELKSKLLAKGVGVIYLRAGKRPILEVPKV
ncbi:MAG: hypothetical protein DRO05_01330 [Thermoproteota archaeon]|nr:MAG: hypothetical protein DRO05_01330 [Candidatus Korarchaeota archaeon]